MCTWNVTKKGHNPHTRPRSRHPRRPAASCISTISPVRSITQQNHRWSGLGLAIVQQLCDAHGWQIQLLPGEAGGTEARLQITERGTQNKTPAE